MVFVELISKRRRHIEQLEEYFVRTSNTFLACNEIMSHETNGICKFNNMTPYPTNEFKINKFVAFLATSVKTVESIKRYCGTICQQHELQGLNLSNSVSDTIRT